MKILQFSKKTPVPPKDGESIAIHQLSKAFRDNNCSLTIFSILTPKHKKKKSALYLDGVDYQFGKINTKISYLDIVKNMFFSNEAYIVERFIDKKIKAKLIKLIQKQDFDLIQLEGVFLGVYIKYIKKYSTAKIILRAHNIEHQIWERLAAKESYFKALYLNKVMIPRLKKFEDKIAESVDGIVSISSLDEQYFKKLNIKAKFKTLPAAYEIKKTIEPLPQDFNVGFIGGLDWQPNAEGIKWFLNSIWKPFVLKNNKANFNLAGRNFPKKYYDLKHSNLFIYGEVDDAQEFTYQNSVMIAPILSGSGMRIKIIEAMALGRTVISTSIGAEGIEYTDKKNIFIADTPEEWIEILTELGKDKNKLEQTALEAQKLIQKKHDINVLGTELVNFYKKEII